LGGETLFTRYRWLIEPKVFLDPDSGRYALINLRIRDFESLLQVVELRQATDLMKQYWLARELTAEADNIFGLMDDGKFCVLLPIDDVQMDEQLIIKTLVNSLEGEFEYGDNTFQISFDVGYALFDGSQSPEALLRNALTALNRGNDASIHQTSTGNSRTSRIRAHKQ